MNAAVLLGMVGVTGTAFLSHSAVVDDNAASATGYTAATMLLGVAAATHADVGPIVGGTVTALLIVAITIHAAVFSDQ